MKPTEQQLDQFVRQNVNLCVSALITSLAAGYHAISTNTDMGRNLSGIAEQAMELSTSAEDYAEAARQADYVQVPIAGVLMWIGAEDKDSPDPMYWSEAREVCNAEGLDPCQWEIYEHWAISEWLAEKLEAKGERIDRNFAGLCVWGRTCTGQSISMDGVIVEICAEALS